MQRTNTMHLFDVYPLVLEGLFCWFLLDLTVLRLFSYPIYLRVFRVQKNLKAFHFSVLDCSLPQVVGRGGNRIIRRKALKGLLGTLRSCSVAKR